MSMRIYVILLYRRKGRVVPVIMHHTMKIFLGLENSRSQQKMEVSYQIQALVHLKLG